MGPWGGIGPGGLWSPGGNGPGEALKGLEGFWGDPSEGTPRPQGVPGALGGALRGYLGPHECSGRHWWPCEGQRV